MAVTELRAPADVLQIRLLGKPELSQNGKLLELSSQKGQALFYYLVATGRPHFRSALAGLLWPELPERNARTNLRVELTKLRRQIGDYLLTSQTEIAFHSATGHWSDLAQLRQAADGHDPVQMASAVALYRDDFLAGFVVPDAPDFESWVVGEQARWRQSYIAILFTLVEVLSAQQAWAAALENARRILAIEPWREDAHRATMRLLARLGQRSAALNHFQRCRQILAEELGVEPTPETVDLYRQIQAGYGSDNGRSASVSHPTLAAQAEQTAIATPSPVLVHIPVAPTRFIGRQTETKNLLDLLRNAECRLVTLVGLGGMGKSRLAIHVAQTLMPDDTQPTAESLPTRFADGIFFIQREPTLAPDLLPDTIARALGIRFRGENNPRHQLFSYLQTRRLLLILDNLETPDPGGAGGDATLVRELLAHAPGLTMLATVRQPLHIEGEWSVQLHGLPIPHPSDGSEEIARFPAVQLFLQRARHLDLGYTISGPEWQVRRQAISRICHLVEGMPLALEMAATWTTTLSCAQIAQEIEDDLAFLSLPQHHTPARHRSLQAVFAHTERRLPPALRRIFASLAVFQGGWTLDAARAIMRATPTDLAQLIDRSLVRRNPQGRYGLHPRLHQFACSMLERLGTERDNLSRAHAVYYRGYLHTHLTGGDPVDEVENIRTAWEWSHQHAALTTVSDFAADLWTFYAQKGWFVEAASMAEALCRREDLTGVRRAVWRRLLGEAYIQQGHYSAALEATAQALTLLGDPLPQRRLGFGLGIARRAILELGQLALRGRAPSMESRRRVQDQSLSTPVEAGAGLRRRELARAHNQLCRVAFFVQDSWLGIYCNARALDHGLQVGASPELAMACVSWSMLCSHFSARLAIHYGNLADHLALPDPEMVATVAGRRAIVDLAMAAWDPLEARLQPAAEIAYREQEWQTWGDIQLIQAVAFYYQARFAESALLLHELERHTRDYSDLTHQALALLVQAGVWLAQARVDEAAERVDRVQTLLLYLAGNHLVNAVAQALYAQILLARNDMIAAETVADRLARHLQGDYIPTPFHLFCYASVAEVFLHLLARAPAQWHATALYNPLARAACDRLCTLARLFPLAQPYAALYVGEHNWYMGQQRRARRLWQQGRARARALQLPHVQKQLEHALARPG